MKQTKAQNSLRGEIKQSTLPDLHMFFAYLPYQTMENQYSKFNMPQN